MSKARLTNAEVVAIVEEAVSRLANEQPDLLDLGFNEQAVSHQLAGYISKSIPEGLRVDVEYDRHGAGAKFLYLPRRMGSRTRGSPRKCVPML
jgi:hypothetical protein